MNNTASNHSRPPVDWTKPLVTRDGKPAKFVQYIDYGPYKRRVSVAGHDNFYMIAENGWYWARGQTHPFDIFNVAEATTAAELDIMKPMQTFDGRPVELLSVDMVKKQMIVRIPQDGDAQYWLHGRYYTERAEHPLNLRNVVAAAAPPPPVFDPTQPVRTRNGRKARIICQDRKCDAGRSIIALTQSRDGTVESFGSYFSNGHAYTLREENPNDLVNE